MAADHHRGRLWKLRGLGGNGSEVTNLFSGRREDREHRYLDSGDLAEFGTPFQRRHVHELHACCVRWVCDPRTRQFVDQEVVDCCPPSWFNGRSGPEPRDGRKPKSWRRGPPAEGLDDRLRVGIPGVDKFTRACIHPGNETGLALSVESLHRDDRATLGSKSERSYRR